MSEESAIIASLIGGINELEQEVIRNLYEVKKCAPPVKLYHYTGLHGLKGILESNCIWASNSNSMNDVGEISYGMSVLKNVLLQYASDHSPSVSTFVNRLSNAIDYNKNKYTKLFETHIVSFTEEPDMLSQWRAYGDEARGVSIEFDFSDSRMLTLTDNEVPHYFDQLPVVYNESLQKKLIINSLDTLINYLNNTKWDIAFFIDSDVLVQGALIGFIIHYFTPLINSFKHPSFYEEREWRAIGACFMGSIKTVKKLKPLNHSSTYLESYFAFDDKDWITQREILPITKIVRGPLSTKESEAKIVELVLENDYHKQLTISKSKIPLR